MIRSCAQRLFVLMLPLAAGCGDGTGPDEPITSCEQASATILAAGEYQVINASNVACVRLPGAGPAGAQYLYVALSAAGTESRAGTSTPFELTANGVGAAATALRAAPGLLPTLKPTAAQQFHTRLRQMERATAQQAAEATGAGVAASVRANPPVLGEQRTFNVLASADADGTSTGDYVQVTATAKYVGTHGAVFLDNAAPTSGGYTQADLDEIGSLFDEHLYPIDQAAFGPESDINQDGLVLILLTDRVTRLAGCAAASFVAGFFYSVDLHPEHVGSNGGEVFYGLVPDLQCSVDRNLALRLLPGVVIHEFQHMINYNQHVLVRDGIPEDTWLNEGLATFAEELGGRQVPDDRCPLFSNDCLTQFSLDNFANAFSYLSTEEDSYLIGPSQPPIALTEYGAAWLFVRWMVDNFADEPTLGHDLTQRLVQTTQIGAANAAAVTGVSFDHLVGEWQLANYLEGLDGFSPGTSRLQYTSWALRPLYASLNSQDPADFPAPYPLVPDETTNGNQYSHAGTLRAGSGWHVVVTQSAGAGAVDLLLSQTTASQPLPSTVVPRVALARIR